MVRTKLPANKKRGGDSAAFGKTKEVLPKELLGQIGLLPSLTSQQELILKRREG